MSGRHLPTLRRFRAASPRRRAWLAFLSALLVVSPVLAGDPQAALRPAAAAPGAQAGATGEVPSASACFSGAPTRTFDVVAINVTVVLNNFGDHDPFGRIYVLREDEAAVKAAVAANPRKPSDLVQPLVLRAHLGDCIEVRFTNNLTDPTTLSQSIGHTMFPSMGLPNPAPWAQHWSKFPEPAPWERASIHIHKALSAVVSSGGSAVGLNADSTAGPGETVVYRWYIPDDPRWEGTYAFHSHGDPRFHAAHGLFGALVAEPKGYEWYHPTTGAPLRSGWEAMLVYPAHLPDKAAHPDFREYAIIFHDEVLPCEAASAPRTCTRLPVVDINSRSAAYGPGTKAINYRTEPFMDRFLLLEREVTNGNLTRVGSAANPLDNAMFDESQAYGSYGNGDPATPIARAYVGDPTKFRLVHGGPGQHHVFHLHGGGDRWRFQPSAGDTQWDDGLVKDNPVQRSPSERLDVQNVGPGEAFDLAIEGGAGGVQQSVGDFLFHCHIVEHYVAGMWGFWRVYDTLQDGTNPAFPGEAPLQPLPDRAPPPRAVNSLGLVGRTLFEGTPAAVTLVNGPTDLAESPPHVNVAEWVQRFLPARGVPRIDDASVWDWKTVVVQGAPLFLGEHEVNRSWVNYEPQTQGLWEVGEGGPGRPELQFHPDNGRPAYPMLHPHLGKRPPFAPDHGPAPYLGLEYGAENPLGLCAEHPDRTSRRYNVVALATPVQYNSRDTDPAGEIFVHAEDKALVRQRPDLAENLILRANVRDCVDVVFTSDLEDNRLNQFHSKVNMHIHLVQFDVQASDGVITGRNFEQSVRPARNASEVTTLAQPAQAGDTVVHVAEPGVFLDAAGAPKVGSALGLSLTEPGFEDAKVAAVDAAAGTVTLDRPLAQAHPAGALVGYEFVKYRWYPDVELGMVYWHDHVAGIKSWTHGLFGGLVVEPARSAWTDPRTGAHLRDGTPATAGAGYHDPHVVDIAPPDAPAYREFVASIQDRTFKNPGGDGAVLERMTGFNLRSAPWDLRRATSDDPAYFFSSVVHGDPATDTVRAYPGDPVVVRLLYAGQSTTRGVETFAVSGHRFAQERHLPGSNVLGALSLGISSQFNLELQCGAGSGYLAVPGDPASCTGHRPGDYLYHLTSQDALVGGAWGLLRVHDKLNSTLRPLPDRAAPPGPADAGFPNDQPPGQERLPHAGAVADPLDVLTPLPVPAQGPGEVGPPGAPVRRFDVVAVSLPVAYDEAGVLAKPHHAQFVLASDAPRLLAGLADPEPLVLRANAGEVVEVTLTNLLGTAVSAGPEALPAAGGLLQFRLPRLPRDEGSAAPVQRVALAPTLLNVDPLASGGITVGYNPDQSLAPGESRTFRWYADTELGAAVLWDYSFLPRHEQMPPEAMHISPASVLGPAGRGAAEALNGAPHLQRGLYGMLVVEPAGSAHLDPGGLVPLEAGARAVIATPDGQRFREFVLLLEHDDIQFDSSTMPYDPTVQGFTGFNYRSEPFARRIAIAGLQDCSLDTDDCRSLGFREVRSPAVSRVMSSRLHGDPATPLFEAEAGEQVVFRVAGANGGQLHTFSLEGHAWDLMPGVAGSNLVDTVTLGPLETANIRVTAGGIAKAPAHAAGDYLYLDHRLAFLEAGAWGLFRVRDPDAPGLPPLPVP